MRQKSLTVRRRLPLSYTIQPLALLERMSEHEMTLGACHVHMQETTSLGDCLDRG